MTVHNAVQPTIEVANTAPIIHDATLAVSEGGAVLLGPSDIGVADLTDSSFTFTVSNVTHGTFQTTTDGVTWVDATTFTTADLAASHVRFVHDGGEIAPTFSIQADDGEALNDNQSNVSAGAVDFTNVDDPAEICGKATGSVVEDTSCTTGGTLTVHDPDSGEAVFQAVPAAALAGIYGNFAFDSASGVWSYELVHSQADSLVAGQVVHDTLTVTSADGTASRIIDVAITGTNDAPVILSETDAPTQTVMVISPSPVVLGSGVNTNSLGLNTETFDGQSTGSTWNNGQGYGNFHSDALNATFSGSGRAGVVSGSSPGVTCPPQFIGPLPGTTDTTHYLSIGAGATETITHCHRSQHLWPVLGLGQFLQCDCFFPRHDAGRFLPGCLRRAAFCGRKPGFVFVQRICRVFRPGFIRQGRVGEQFKRVRDRQYPAKIPCRYLMFHALPLRFRNHHRTATPILAIR